MNLEKTDHKPMSKKRCLWYQKEIQILKEIDNQITFKFQHQLNVLDHGK